jgi:hypothetical protein
MVPQIPSAIYVPNRKNIDTQTDVLEVESLSSSNRSITETEEQELDQQTTISNKRTQQSSGDTLLTPRDVITKSYKRKKTSNQVSGENSNMVIVS